MKIVKTAAPLGFETVTLPNGKTIVLLIGNTFPLRYKLKPLGFFYDDGKLTGKKTWYVPQEKFTPQLQQAVQGLQNIPPTSQTAKPTAPKTPQNWYNQQVKRNWLLAETTNDPDFPEGTLVALSKGQNGSWDCIFENGAKGNYKDNEYVKQVAKTIRDANNQLIQGFDPQELFDKYKGKVTTPNNAVQEKPADPDETGQPTDTKGRIPEEKLSVNQKQIEEAFVKTPKNIMISALAGTGKTSTLRHLASFKKPGEKWLYLVFNKKNQIEASTGAKAFAGGIDVLTSHSFLGRILGSNAEQGTFPKTNIWSQSNEKVAIIIDNIFDGAKDIFPEKQTFLAKKAIKQIASLSKNFGINPANPDVAKDIYRIIKQYDIDTTLSSEKVESDTDFSKLIVDNVIKVLNYSLPGKCIMPKLNNIRDHDDTLWFTSINNNISWPHYDVVLADEVQDFNRCQINMLQKLKEAGARLITVGDKNQALYSFRGGDSKAFDSIQALTGNEGGGFSGELPINYRSKQKIIQFVNQHTKVKNLQAASKEEGVVTQGQKRENVLDALIQEFQTGQGKLTQQTAFIARTNKPLVNTALQLMQNDVDFAIIGRDFSQELINFVQSITGKGKFRKNMPIQTFDAEIEKYTDEIRRKWSKRISKQGDLKESESISTSMMALISHLNLNGYHDKKLNMSIQNTDDFVEYIKKRFEGINVDTIEGKAQYDKLDPKSMVTLSTGHRSKGLEFERVFILAPNEYPHSKAKTPEQLEQEDNNWYVSLTRAMSELHVLAPEEDKKTPGIMDV